MDLFLKNSKLIKQNRKQFHLKKGYCPYSLQYEFPVSKDGFFGLILPMKEKKITIHSRYYPSKECERWVDRQHISSDTIVVFGLGLGYILPKLSACKAKKIYCIEPDKNLFLKSLHLFDFEAFENIVFIVGYDEFEAVEFIEENPTVVEILEFKPIVQLHIQYFKNLYQRLNNLPIYEFDTHWKYKKFQSSRTRVLFIDCSYVLSKECITGLQQNNCDVKYLHLDQQSYDYEQFIRSLLQEIGQFKPDFVLTVNHLGFDAEGRLTELFETLELPFASWFVDSPTVILSTQNHNVSDYCSLFVWDRDYIEDVKNAGFNHVHYLPLATLPSLFKPLHLPKQFDVSFVGSSMVNAIHKNLKRMVWRSDLMAKLEATASLFLTMKTRYVHEAMSIFEEKNGEYAFDSFAQKKDFEAAVLWRATQKYRFSGVQKLAAFYPAIHGDPGWDDFLDFRYKIGREIMYYDHMPEFYNVSKINFNMTSCQMKNAVNQRVFDVPACNQFLITDYKKQLDEIFEQDEIVYFNDVEEIPELVSFYLKNDSIRKAKAKKAHDRIIRNETYRHRLAQLVKMVKQNYSK